MVPFAVCEWIGTQMGTAMFVCDFPACGEMKVVGSLDPHGSAGGIFEGGRLLAIGCWVARPTLSVLVEKWRWEAQTRLCRW